MSTQSALAIATVSAHYLRLPGPTISSRTGQDSGTPVDGSIKNSRKSALNGQEWNYGRWFRAGSGGPLYENQASLRPGKRARHEPSRTIDSFD